MLNVRLRSLGFRSTAETSGCDAINKSRSHQFDLVVTDLNMPDGGGIELIKDLRIRSDTPIILLSGYLESDHLVRHFEKVEVLAKPFDSRSFARIVRKLIPQNFDRINACIH